ncbi:MAG: gamma-glutamylcyclotransferase family protein [Actinomycetota bacterium]
MAYFFAYGDRMNPEKMLETAPEAKAVGPARLDGYRLAFNVQSRSWGGGGANAVADPDGSLWGLLWEVSYADLEGFDTFRGDDGSAHRVIDLDVHGPDGPVPARTFLVISDAGFIRPTERYVAMLRAVAERQGLPAEALEEIDRASMPPDAPHPSI